MRLLLTSDWHLDAVTAGVERFDDVSESAALAVTVAIERQVDAFVFIGDLCNPGSSRSLRAIAFAQKIVMRLAADGIHSVWLAGNHDVVEDGHGTTTLAPLASAFPEVAMVVTRPSYGDLHGGIPFVALPYVSRSGDYDPDEHVRVAAPSLSVGKNWTTPPVVLSHLSIPRWREGGEAEMPRGREVVLPSSAIAETLPAALVVNGHYHRPVMPEGTVAPKGVVIPGSLQRLRFCEEDDACGFIIAESDGGPWEVTFESVAARPLRTVEPGDKLWTTKRVSKKRVAEIAKDNALARLRPPAGAGERAEKIEGALWAAGAAAVKVLPPEAEDAVVLRGDDDASAPAVASHREVVSTMVDEANTEDRDALRSVVEETMDAEGM